MPPAPAWDRTLVCCALSCVAAACLDLGSTGADLVFLSGGVYTVDVERSWAEAVAVDDGDIVFVGTNEDAASFIGARTEVVDLTGRMLLPGLHDSHVHPVLGMILEPLCRLDEATSVEKILEAIRACAAETDDEWVLAFGWRSSIFLPDIAPSKVVLDAVVPDRPAVLVAKDMHTFWLNSRALDEVGITAATPAPAGGEIVREPRTGEPAGALRDTAVEVVARSIPRPGLLASLRRLRATIGTMNRYGYTSLMDARVDSRETAWAYRLLDLVGLLDVRVSLAMLLDPRADLSQLEEMTAMREAFSKGRIQAHNVKIFVDGGTAVRSAASAAYDGDVPSAEPYIDRAALTGYVTALDAEGFDVHLHTLGDRATTIALDAIAAARRTNRARDRRHVITHLVYPHPDDLARFGPLEVIANICPYWAFPNEWSASFLPVLGVERRGWMYPFRTLADDDVLLTAGSDYPFTPLNPFLAIEVGLTRRDPEGLMPEALEESQALELDDLLAAYTINAAYQLRREDRTGSIEVGKAADLIVIDRDLFATAAQQIGDTRVLMTLIDGEVVYDQRTASR